jgi:hypothetical protein
LRAGSERTWLWTGRLSFGIRKPACCSIGWGEWFASVRAGSMLRRLDPTGRSQRPRAFTTAARTAGIRKGRRGWLFQRPRRSTRARFAASVSGTCPASRTATRPRSNSPRPLGCGTSASVGSTGDPRGPRISSIQPCAETTRKSVSGAAWISNGCVSFDGSDRTGRMRRIIDLAAVVATLHGSGRVGSRRSMRLRQNLEPRCEHERGL